MSGFLKKIIKFSLILIAVFSFTNITLAQEVVSNSISSVYINIEPNNPRTGESVVLTVGSELLNLDSSRITWYIDNVARKETTSKSITIKAKNNGEKTTIKVVVETPDGVTREALREFSPSGVDLVVEPMSYTLPFYKGKPFFISQGIVKIVALPDIMINGEKVPSKNLTFRWMSDDSVLGANSGVGKDSLTLSGTIPVRDINIRVEVKDSSGNILAQNSKTIMVNDPEILFYENSPLYGILYNKAITGSYYLGTREELKIVAKPFSFDFPNEISAEANYVWYVNGNYVTPSEKINEILLRQTATNLKGTASISLNINNTKKIFQSTKNNFNIGFGQ